MSVPTIDGSLFSWSGRRGVAEASTIGFPPATWPVAFEVWSARTGATKVFVKVHDPTDDSRLYSSGDFEVVVLDT